MLSENTNTNERLKMSHADFDSRLREARKIRNELSLDKESDHLGNGRAKVFRIGSEIILATIVGGGIGFFIDSWLNTKPWFLISFFLIGNFAGLWNVFRLTHGHNYRIGFERKSKAENKTVNNTMEEAKDK